MTIRRLAVLTVLLAGGCAPAGAPLPSEQAVARADAAADADAVLHLQLVHSFRQAPAAAMARLADPNERIARAAATAAARAVGRDESLCQRMVDHLSDAIATERRPAVLAAQLDSLAPLLADRIAPLEASCARQGLDAMRRQTDPALAAQRAIAERLLGALAEARPGRLGDNVYDGPGWRTDRPKAAPTRRAAPAYREPIHTVPIVARGELHLGDFNADGAMDYLILDPADTGGLHVRMTRYSHAGQMVWSPMLAGAERPVCLPPGELPDLDGDGRAEIVYVDRAGRVVITDAAGTIVRRSQPFHTLDGEPYFGDRPIGLSTSRPDDGPRPAIHLANFRGAGRRDLLLVCGRHLLAMTEKFQTLWHVRLDFADPAGPTLLGDLDGDGCNEIIRGNVAVSPRGRVLWVWPHEVAAATLGRLAGLDRPVAVLVDPDGTAAAFDAAGMLWQADTLAGRCTILTGRFAPARRLIGIAAPAPEASRAPEVSRAVLGPGIGRARAALDALGQPDFGIARTLLQPKTTGIAVDPLSLTCDWNGDGLDEVWGRDKSGLPAWLTWPAGPAVERIPQATHVIGLFDVNGDGAPELLYYQGNSLVIHQRGGAKGVAR